MNPYQKKIFGLVPLWAVFVALGCFIMLASAAGSFLFRSEIRERVKTVNAPTPTPYLITETDRIEQRIKFLEDQIKSEERLGQIEGEVPFYSAAEKDRRRQARAEKFGKWEEEIAALKEKKEELSKKPPEIKPVGWFEKYYVEGLIPIIVVAGAAAGCAAAAMFSKIGWKPGDRLTDLDERALLFLMAAVFGTLAGFLLFIWYLLILT